MKSAPSKTKGAARKNTRPATPTDVVRSGQTPEKSGLQWTFLTNHSHVLILLARNPSLVLREIALQVGITERAVQRIIGELELGGFVKREKVGRQNHYQIQANRPLRHPIESHRTIGDLLELVNSSRR